MRADAKPEGLRQAMSWLHTWSSLVLGWLLFAVFLLGTVSFLRLEFDEWMRPELQHSRAAQATQAQLLEVALAHLHQQAPTSANWTVSLPGDRQSMLAVSWRKPPEPGAAPGGRPVTVTHYLQADTGQVITPRETRGGGFLYRFHFELYAMPRIWARWIVSIATAAMLVAIISGVITHKKIFSDFFTFRPKKGQRSWLDAHNASAVLSLPFHFVITLSGLLLLMNMLLPWTAQYVYEGQGQQFLAELRGQTPPQPASNAQNPARQGEGAARGSQGQGQGQNSSRRTAEQAQPSAPAPTVSAAMVTPLLEHAAAQWGPGQVARIIIDAPNTARTSIELRQETGETLSQRGAPLALRWRLDPSGEPQLQTPKEATPPSFIRATYNILTATHLGRFAEPAVRWLLVIAGLSGVFMVASGMVLWVVKRLPQRAKEGRTPRGHRLVEILNVAAIAGLPLAMAAYMGANRLLPVEMAARADAEIRVFFLVWLAALAHAAIRPHRSAWREQMLAAAAAFGALPIVGAVTGGVALPLALIRGQWGPASVDVFCLLLAASCAVVVWWLDRAKPAVKSAMKPAVKAAAKASPKPVAKPTTKAVVQAAASSATPTITTMQESQA